MDDTTESTLLRCADCGADEGKVRTAAADARDSREREEGIRRDEPGARPRKVMLGRGFMSASSAVSCGATVLLCLACAPAFERSSSREVFSRKSSSPTHTTTRVAFEPTVFDDRVEVKVWQEETRIDLVAEWYTTETETRRTPDKMWGAWFFTGLPTAILALSFWRLLQANPLRVISIPGTNCPARGRMHLAEFFLGWASWRRQSESEAPLAVWIRWRVRDHSSGIFP